MRIARIAQEGARAMGAHRLRTFFMMLGTLIGIAALVVIMAVGAGVRDEVMGRVAKFGSRALMVNAGGGRGFSPPQDGVVTMVPDDADAILSRVDGVEMLSRMARKGDASVRWQGEQTYAAIFGVEPNWPQTWDWGMQEGRWIGPDDMATMGRVCVLGTTVARDLFGGLSPVGESIMLDNVSCEVIGVQESRGTSPMGGDMDNRVMVPLTTALRRLFNQDHLNNIRVVVRDPARAEAVAEEIRELLRERHRIVPPQEDDFAVVASSDVAQAAMGVQGTLTRLLVALTSLSLLVGGIVLMNILLLSVNERKREIGVRRALGARERDIFLQFLAESVAVTLAGMLAGVLVGWGVVAALGVATPIPVALTWEPVAVGLVFSLVVGLVFGIQPARRAARLDPVRTLA